MSALCKRYTFQLELSTGIYSHRKAQNPTIFPKNLCSPKAEVTGSTPVGCTNTSNNLEQYQHSLITGFVGVMSALRPCGVVL